VDRWPNTYVGVRYADVTAGTAWLQRAFGFTVRETIGPVTVLESPGGGVCVVAALDDEHGEQDDVHIPSPSISMTVPDVDAHHAVAAREGARILMPPRDLPWGLRGYAVLDVGGHHWQFAQPVDAT
jgi:uncharacterized glyoxalase superfamily protein PhnB